MIRLPALVRLAAAVALLLPAAPAARAQNTRLADNSRIGWLTNTTTVRFAPRWSAHLEYQFRRTEWLGAWQQSLLRTGLNFHLNEQVTFRLGYAWVETFPYGEIPIQAAGRQFREHRLYQMAALANPVGRVEISHRFMLEQRWLRRYNLPETGRPPSETVYVNRVRYMYRMQVPLFKPTLGDRTAYAAAYDEVLLGFGRNVNENVFDQNRLGLLLGYRFRSAFRVEGGFFQQLLQLPREVGGRNVFQTNNGFIFNTVINLDLRRKPA